MYGIGTESASDLRERIHRIRNDFIGNRAHTSSIQSKVDIAIGCHENGIHLIVRKRVLGSARRKEPGISRLPVDYAETFLSSDKDIPVNVIDGINHLVQQGFSVSSRSVVFHISGRRAEIFCKPEQSASPCSHPYVIVGILMQDI